MENRIRYRRRFRGWVPATFSAVVFASCLAQFSPLLRRDDLLYTFEQLSVYDAPHIKTAAYDTEHQFELNTVNGMPSFGSMHDFASGPRSVPFQVGLSKAELLNGTAISYTQLADGTVSRTIKPLSSMMPGSLGSASERTTSYAGLTKEQANDGYAAAWLTTVEGVLDNPKISRQHLYVDGNPNLEFGHFVMSYRNDARQSVDMFDFFVHHLSYYLKIINARSPSIVNDTIVLMQRMQQDYHDNNYYNNALGQRNGRTLAILPYYAASLAGPQQQLSRLFLNVTVKAVSAVFPNVVVFVSNNADYKYVSDVSGLNRYLYDVQLVEDLRRDAHLTYGTSVKTKTLFEQGVYSRDDFDFVYYTETDQIPHLRDVNYLLYHASLPPKKSNPVNYKATVIVPHRGQPYPVPDDVSASAVEEHRHQFQRSYLDGRRVIYSVPDLMSKSCCFDRPKHKDGPFISDHPQLPIDNETMAFFRQHNSFALVAGTGNVFRRIFYLCQYSDQRKMCHL